MKLLLLGRRLATQRAATAAATVRRCATGSSGKSSGGANSVQSVREATPGTVRVRRGADPRAKELEMDTTIARIMGSDWGDRSKQPVSLAMRLYWGIFIIVLANGAYTYFAGKDEAYLVDKVQKKVDAKLGRVETNEFVVMQTNGPNPTSKEEEDAGEASASAAPSQATVKAKPATKDEGFELADTAPKSVFSSTAAPTPMPYFGPPAAQRAPTKADYERQLQQLRQRQARAKEERKDPTSFRSVDEIDIEIKRIDQQKAHIKQVMKQL